MVTCVNTGVGRPITAFRAGEDLLRDRVSPVLFLGLQELDDPVAVCEELSRRPFRCFGAPLRVRAATGSPINPIAIFRRRQAGNHSLRAMPGA
jgi:hypothetical protein